MRQANDNPGTPARSDGFGCDESRAFLHLAIEGELDRLRSAQLGAHLETCTGCSTLHTELLDEKRWLLENAIRSPRLRDGFAAGICDQLRAEGATSGDLSDPLEDVAGHEMGAGDSEPFAKSPSSRLSAVSEALPWLSAAAVAILLACLGGMVERNEALPTTLVETARVDRTGDERVATATTTGVEMSSGLSSAVDETPYRAEVSGHTTIGQAVSRVIRSPDYCSLDTPLVQEPAFASFHCPSIDVFSEDELASESAPVGTSFPHRLPTVSVVVQRVPLENGRINATELALRPGTAVRRSAPQRQDIRHKLARTAVADGGVLQGSPRTIGHVLVLTHRLASRQTAREPIQSEDPCRDDTNKDGELDYRDVTHMCQVLMKPETAEVPGGFLAMARVPGAEEEPDCEEDEDCI